MRYFKKSLCLIFLIISTLMACSKQTVEDTSSFVDLPTPGPGKAIIFGRILNFDTEEPTVGVPYLARSLVSDDPELPTTISFSLQNDPGATYNFNTGTFYFENIDPGNNYVIILFFGPGNTLVVKEFNSQRPMLISINSGEILNLGTLTIREP